MDEGAADGFNITPTHLPAGWKISPSWSCRNCGGAGSFDGSMRVPPFARTWACRPIAADGHADTRPFLAVTTSMMTKRDQRDSV